MVLFVLGAGVFYWITTNLVKSKMTKARQDEQAALKITTGHVQETMQDLLNVRFYGMSDAVDRLLNKANQDYQQAGKRALHLSVLQSSLSNLGYSVADVGSLALALFLVQRGEMILSDAMFIWPMRMQAAYAVNRMGSLMIEWQEPVVAVDRVREKLSLPTTSESFEGSVTHDEPFVGPLSITFEDVSFRYPSTDDSEVREVLSDFSLYVPTGQKLAVLGQSGSGKSTLVKLLLRFYEPTRGRILVNDIPIKEISLETLRAAFAYMPQAPHLFAGSIRENFLIMNSTLNDEEMRTALNLVGLDSFAGDDGDVLDHAVGTSGNLLSGGERQRFGIARALVRGCRSYLMDEMTSALDGANDRKVTEMFMNLPDTTMLWITHRTDQLHLADRVIMMEKGRLIQDEVRDLVESE